MGTGTSLAIVAAATLTPAPALVSSEEEGKRSSLTGSVYVPWPSRGRCCRCRLGDEVSALGQATSNCWCLVVVLVDVVAVETCIVVGAMGGRKTWTTKREPLGCCCCCCCCCVSTRPEESSCDEAEAHFARPSFRFRSSWYTKKSGTWRQCFCRRTLIMPDRDPLWSRNKKSIRW
jgi:hypothetical protein